MNAPSVPLYVPFDAGQYERPSDLSSLELTILSNRLLRSNWRYLQSELPGLMSRWLT